MEAILKKILSIIERPFLRFKSFGKGSVIKPWPRRIRGARFVSIGENCFFGDGLVLIATEELHGVRHRPSCIIDDGCVFGSDINISCTNTIVFGKNVLVGSRVFIGDSYHDYEDVTKPVIDQPMAGEAPIRIGDGSFLGIGCAILPGTQLGKGCYVSANSLVGGTFPDHTVISGAPARAVRRYDPVEQKWKWRF
jgi:acetyltransferase-like isoleucine patch superfamily enzyme